jgi:chaperonin GroES
MLQQLESTVTINKQLAQEPNITDRLSSHDIATLGTWVFAGYQRDKTSRSKWESRMEAAMDLAMQIQKDKSFPWPNCSNVTFPLVTIASLQFSSRSYGNIIQGTDIVKYRTIGKDPDSRLHDQADRISKHMSWQVLEEDCAWEEQHDRLLINLGIVGCNFIKTYFSPAVNCPVSELVMARDFVLDYWAKSVENCARKTQVIRLYRNDIYERVQAGTFRNVLDEAWFNEAPALTSDDNNSQQANRQGVVNPQPDEDAPFTFYEQHRLLDLDHDGYAEPYIATIEEQSQCLVKLTARWEREEDVDYVDRAGVKPRSKIRRIRSTEYFTKYGFIPAPDGGIYDVGFGTLLGPLNESVNSGINQLLDAGTMSNSNGGFLGRGVKIRGGVYTMAPFEWKRVDSTGDDLRKAMVPFPKNEPSAVMFQLLGLLIEYTDRIAGTTDPMVGMNPGQNTPAETSRNTMEQGMKVYQGIFKRVWRSMKEEFKKRHQLNAVFLQQRQRFGNAEAYILQEDYRSNPDLVIPAADPNLVSDGQRLNQAAAMRESSMMVPGYDRIKVEKNFLRALKVDDIDTFFPGPDQVPPLPNPKAALEQMKLEAVKMKIEFSKWEFVKTLQKDAAKNQAEIIKLYAEVGKLLAETQTEKVKAKVEAFSAIVEALETHQNMLTQQIETMSQMGGNEGDAGDKGSGVPGMAAKPGDAGAQALPAQG